MRAEWIPTVEHARDQVGAGAARDLHDLLDRPGSPPTVGGALPILWHWVAFTPQARQADIGQDGHPMNGRLLPPTSGRRRMYAGGKVSVTGDVHVDEPLDRTSVVSEVAEKQGKSGPLMFVTVDHEVSAQQGTIFDRNDLVYKEPKQENATNTAHLLLVDREWAWGRTAPIDPVILFRFSALTYNSHRIHYDRTYATDVEGYPGLVVHGPLQAILLADLVHRTFADRAITSFTFRSNAPAFDDGPLELRARHHPESDTLELAAFTNEGKQTMSANATLAPQKEELQ
jgi:3-methylfumaryl-CoA hydratase